MGERGPAPRRDDERRRRNEPAHPIVKAGPEELRNLPFEIDLEPDPMDADPAWEQIVKDLWADLLADPARMWMTRADWGVARLHFESMSRDLAPQVVGVTETGQVLRDRVPIKGANLASYQKLFASIGVLEANRLRMQKEITLFPPPQTVADGDKVVDIKSARRDEVV